MAKRVERGTVLGGRFGLEDLIGSGGMGSVYSAADLEQGFRVAVKLLNPRLARATEFRERVVDESKHAASIPHPHILTVHDHGEDENVLEVAAATAVARIAGREEDAASGWPARSPTSARRCCRPSRSASTSAPQRVAGRARVPDPGSGSTTDERRAPCKPRDAGRRSSRCS